MATSETASLPSGPLLSVLMPVYNEARTLRTIVARVLASPVQLPMELICVDDGSRDGSPEILDALESKTPVRFFVGGQGLVSLPAGLALFGAKLAGFLELLACPAALRPTAGTRRSDS